MLFSSEMPEGVEFVNEVLTKKRIEQFVAHVYLKLGLHKTVTMLDKLKKLGFEYATRAGMSVGPERCADAAGKS